MHGQPAQTRPHLIDSLQMLGNTADSRRLPGSHGGLQHEFVGSWRLADREILFSQETSLLRVPTNGQPEFGRVVSKGLWVARHQLVVLCCGNLAPMVGFVQSSPLFE